MEVSVPAAMPLDFSMTVKSRHQQDPQPSGSPPASGLVLPASVASSSAGLLKLLKESGAARSGGATPAGESSSAFRVVTPKGKFEGTYFVVFNRRVITPNSCEKGVKQNCCNLADVLSYLIVERQLQMLRMTRKYDYGNSTGREERSGRGLFQVTIPVGRTDK
jgi:hypothetical protein